MNNLLLFSQAAVLSALPIFVFKYFGWDVLYLWPLYCIVSIVCYLKAREMRAQSLIYLNEALDARKAIIKDIDDHWMSAHGELCRQPGRCREGQELGPCKQPNGFFCV
jgi:hypothetical protein